MQEGSKRNSITSNEMYNAMYKECGRDLDLKELTNIIALQKEGVVQSCIKVVSC